MCEMRRKIKTMAKSHNNNNNNKLKSQVAITFASNGRSKKGSTPLGGGDIHRSGGSAHPTSSSSHPLLASSLKATGGPTARASSSKKWTSPSTVAQQQQKQAMQSSVWSYFHPPPSQQQCHRKTPYTKASPQSWKIRGKTSNNCSKSIKC